MDDEHSVACLLLQDVSDRKIRFTSNYSPNVLFDRIADIVRQMGLQIQKAPGKVSPILDIRQISILKRQLIVLIHCQLKVLQKLDSKKPKNTGSLCVWIEVI